MVNVVNEKPSVLHFCALQVTRLGRTASSAS
jgi:hypothetical protein